MERNQEVLPKLKDREILETFSSEELLEYKSFLLEKYTELERQVHLVNDLLSINGIELEEG